MAKPCKTMWTGVVLGALTLSPVAKPQAATCTAAQAVAVVVSTQGTVTDAGHTLRSGEPLCAGDQIRTAANSRAVLRLAHGNAMFHLDAGTVLEMHAPAERDSVGLIEGAINALFRQPGELEIDTPILNASIKGTEYLVRVQPDGANTVAVFDGVVQVQGHGGVEAAQGAVAVASGQRVSVKAGNTLSPGALKVAVASDELAWSLYFPPVVSTTAAAPVRAAAEQLSQGNPMAAEALLGDPSLANDASALALRAVSAVVRNAPTAARELAEQAVTLAPDNAAAHIALSYARQANLAVDGALATLEDCVNTKSCDSQQPVFQARLIELKLASGDTRGALRHCPEPVDDARAMACGFAQLANGKSTLAGTLLAQAVTAQPGNPLARLGLGLARIRGNDVPGGRAEIETAMLLDPLQSVIRSYLGKAYFEERHCPTGLGGARCGWLSTRPLDLALEQYDIARRLDPKDPTPDLYSAIAKQAYNRPVEALTDLQRSIDKNDNRAVYRSSLLLDRDEASRAAGLAQLYRGLGFDQLALAEGYRSLAVDPGNFAAHRFLADAYSALPRHDVARVSEVLQTQLLQPINAAPLPPQLGEQDQQAFSGAGPASLSFNEFNAAFLRNGLSGTLDTVFGSNETFGQNLGANLVQDRYSVHFGFYGYDTDGRRSNNDDSRRLYDVFGQLQVLANTMLIAEFKHLDTETGDLDAKFDEDAFESLRNSAPTDQYRVACATSFHPLPRLSVITPSELRATLLCSGSGFPAIASSYRSTSSRSNLNFSTCGARRTGGKRLSAGGCKPSGRTAVLISSSTIRRFSRGLANTRRPATTIFISTTTSTSPAS